MRYKFLVVVGASRTGKTVWCKWILDDPELVFETNCANCPEPDLRDFKPLKHKAILFDEASPAMVIAQKKLFQCPACFVSLGMSVTNCHSYNVFVSGVQMLICSNTWLEELEALPKAGDREWLIANTVLLDVGTDPLFLVAQNEPRQL